ncbi:unnamed protein product [Cochlearia groenlandica]
MLPPTTATAKKPSPMKISTQLPSLPNDLLLNRLARVPRLYYPTLSLVSNSFGSLIASPELYNTRSLLGHGESCLYVCLLFNNDRNPTWFTLCSKPNQTLANSNTKNNNNEKKKKKKKSSGYVLDFIKVVAATVSNS